MSYFKTDEEIEREYLKTYEDIKKRKEAEANRLKAEKDSLYDENSKQAYIGYMQSKKQLPEQLSALGVTGGATESSMLRADTGYEDRLAGIGKQRSSDKTAIDTALTNELNTYQMTADENKRNEMAQERAKRAQWEENERAKEESRFGNTISGWDTVGSIDSEVAAIRSRGNPNEQWKIQYLMAQRAALLANALSNSSGSGGRSRSSYRGGGGGGGGSLTTTPETPTVETETETKKKGKTNPRSQWWKKNYRLKGLRVGL